MLEFYYPVRILGKIEGGRTFSINIGWVGSIKFCSIVLFFPFGTLFFLRGCVVLLLLSSSITEKMTHQFVSYYYKSQY